MTRKDVNTAKRWWWYLLASQARPTEPRSASGFLNFATQARRPQKLATLTCACCDSQSTARPKFPCMVERLGASFAIAWTQPRDAYTRARSGGTH